jgi:hypothetical protein
MCRESKSWQKNITADTLLLRIFRKITASRTASWHFQQRKKINLLSLSLRAASIAICKSKNCDALLPSLTPAPFPHSKPSTTRVIAGRSLAGSLLLRQKTRLNAWPFSESPIPIYISCGMLSSPTRHRGRFGHNENGTAHSSQKTEAYHPDVN